MGLDGEPGEQRTAPGCGDQRTIDVGASADEFLGGTDGVRERGCFAGDELEECGVSTAGPSRGQGRAIPGGAQATAAMAAACGT